MSSDNGNLLQSQRIGKFNNSKRNSSTEIGYVNNIDSLNAKLSRTKIENPLFVLVAHILEHSMHGPLSKYDQQVKILEIDGDFMYLVAAAAAVAVSTMTLAVILIHFHLVYSNSLCCLLFFWIFECYNFNMEIWIPDNVCKPLVEAKKAEEDLVVCFSI
ncbi:hypothetical protein E2542_SST05018 [Spatholobus suberectus]|nr:hypothetical protein E2542_SST05018 [Spatholobus suberectus]